MPIIATDPDVPVTPTRPAAAAAIKPEVVMAPPPVVAPTTIEPGTALVRFRLDPAGLKSSALAVLDIKLAPVETVEDASALTDKIAQARLVLKNIEARRKLIVEPLKKEATAVDQEAKRWSEPITAWSDNAERIVLAFRRKQADDARRAEEARQQAIRDAAVKQQRAEIVGNTEAAEAASAEIMRAEAAPPAQEIKAFKTESGTASVRTRWKVEVVDPSLVPDRYMVPDLKLLQAAVDGGARQIEGCNVFPDESLSVRTR